MQMQISEEFKYYIDMIGLIPNCVGDVTIDNKYKLLQRHPTYQLAVIPIKNKNHPNFNEVVFYANCLAFDHDIPVSITPIEKDTVIESILDIDSSKDSKDKYYYKNLSSIYSSIFDMKYGSCGIEFRFPGHDKRSNIFYVDKYKKVEKEINLYSSALRQGDPLAEYLNYYRIIESISKNNGKEWIKDNIDRIKKYNFPTVIIKGFDRKTQGDLFSIYKTRALQRLKFLEEKLANDELNRYLYHENRCGIAHGKSNIKQYDFDKNVKTIVKDNYILKLLTRIGIKDKI
jgi:hypothetical protein